MPWKQSCHFGEREGASYFLSPGRDLMDHRRRCVGLVVIFLSGGPHSFEVLGVLHLQVYENPCQ